MPNPVIPGLYADPNLVRFGDTYFIYATTDGFPNWGATSFEVWSSKDLVNWTNEGVILDVAADVSWASGRAWAPAVVARHGRYYLYFTAEQSIGVAVADAPTGPFREALGRPLVDKEHYFPDEHQQIDPSVFADDDGTYYLYWGNGVPRIVPLNDDMVSYDPSAIEVMDGLVDFVEAPWVLKHGGLYHLTWSQGITRSPDYRVGYATGPTPRGPWTYHGVLLRKDEQQGILSTGHHSIVQAHTGDWYIAYHMWAIPDGDGMHRQILIDHLHMAETGLFDKVAPTLTGIAPLEPITTLASVA